MSLYMQRLGAFYLRGGGVGPDPGRHPTGTWLHGVARWNQTRDGGIIYDIYVIYDIWYRYIYMICIYDIYICFSSMASNGHSSATVLIPTNPMARHAALMYAVKPNVNALLDVARWRKKQTNMGFWSGFRVWQLFFWFVVCVLLLSVSCYACFFVLPGKLEIFYFMNFSDILIGWGPEG